MSRAMDSREEEPQYAEEIGPWSYELSDGVEGGRPSPRRRSGARAAAPSKPRLRLPPAMPPRESKRRRLTPLSVGLGAGAIGCLALAVGLWASSALSQRRTAELSPIDALVEDADLVTEDHDGLPLTDEEAAALEPDPWEGAEESYPGLAAWLEVGGTDISTPVMQASEDAPDWFLDHDAFGNESANGLPYLDFRCTADGALRVVYAHNLGWGSSEGFGALADAWQQESFERLGTVRWANLATSAPSQQDSALEDESADLESARERHVEEYRPILALKLGGDESDVFDFDLSSSDTAKWLDTVIPRADATTSGGRAGGAMSSHYLALVTCAGDGYPSESRTLVLYGDGDEAYFEFYGDLLEGIEAMAAGTRGSDDMP